MLASLVWYWRICKKFPEAAMLLAVLPLFFAWRSLPSYFYCAAYPLFILMAARAKASHASKSTRGNDHWDRDIDFSLSSAEKPVPAIPAAVGFRAASYTYSVSLFHHRSSFRL